jgi:hypothetical protein
MAFASALDRGSALFAKSGRVYSTGHYSGRMLLSDDYGVFGHVRRVKYSSKVLGFKAVNTGLFDLRVVVRSAFAKAYIALTYAVR